MPVAPSSCDNEIFFQTAKIASWRGKSTPTQGLRSTAVKYINARKLHLEWWHPASTMHVCGFMLLVMALCWVFFSALTLLSALLRTGSPFENGSEDSSRTTSHSTTSWQFVRKGTGTLAAEAIHGGPRNPPLTYLGYGLDGCRVSKGFHHFNSILLAGNVKRVKPFCKGKRHRPIWLHSIELHFLYGKIPLQKWCL